MKRKKQGDSTGFLPIRTIRTAAGRIKRLYSDTEAEGYIRTCIVLLCLMALLSCVLFYASGINIAQNVRQGVVCVMDSTLKRESTLYSGLMDDGNSADKKEIPDNFRELFENYFSGLVKNADGSYSLYSSEGELLWQMTYPVLTVSGNSRLTLTASFDLSVPVRFAGERISLMVLHMSLSRSYMPKFE